MLQNEGRIYRNDRAMATVALPSLLRLVLVATRTRGLIPEPYEPLGRFEHVIDADGSLVKLYTNDNAARAASEPPRVVIVLYDVFGFGHPSKNIFRSCDLLAKQGFTVVALDHFRGSPWYSPGEPRPDPPIAWRTWWTGHSSVDPIRRDVADILLPRCRERYNVSSVAVLGTCWGGLMAMQLADGRSSVHAAVSVHGTKLTADIARLVEVPVAVFPSSSDPSTKAFQAVLRDKSVGARCDFHRFSRVRHGFFAGRGNWSDPDHRAASTEVVARTRAFLLLATASVGR